MILAARHLNALQATSNFKSAAVTAVGHVFSLPVTLFWLAAVLVVIAIVVRWRA